MGIAILYLMVAVLMSVTLYTEIRPQEYSKEQNTTPWNVFLQFLILGLFWPFVILVMTMYYLLELSDIIKDYVHDHREK
jgi:hypothetical protein